MKPQLGIIGHSGFIGEHLKQTLDSNDYDVQLFNGDILDNDLVDNFVQNKACVVHLAGVFSNDFDKLLEVNLKGTRIIVDAAKKHNVSKFIFTSTGAVFGGNTRKNGMSETDQPHPTTLYGLSKLFCEDYIIYSNINYIVLRFPNVYGPGNQKGVIYNFLKSIQEKNSIEIHGDGNNKRDFLFVSDACTAIINSINTDLKKEMFHISNDNYDLNTLASIIKRHTNTNFTVNYSPADPANKLDNLYLNITKAKEKLNWTPMVGLEDGIRKLVEGIK